MTQAAKSAPKTVSTQEKSKRMNTNGNFGKGLLIVLGILLGVGTAINGYLASTLIEHISDSNRHETGEQKANRIRVVFNQEIGKSAALQALTKKDLEHDIKIEKLSDQLEEILQAVVRVEAKLDSK